MDFNTKALDNYQFILSLPIVVELIKKNKKLRKENKSLKNLIYSIPEFRCKCSNSNTIIENKSKKIVSLRKTFTKSTETDEKNIVLNHVKTEKIDNVNIINDSDDDDSVVFINEVKKEVTPNIVYVLEEEAEEELEEGEIRQDELVEEAEEVVEEEAEEAEEEVVEEEEEEEEEEAEEEEEEAEEVEEVVDEVVEEEEVEEEVVEEEVVDEVVEEEEAEEEVFEIEIKGKSYYTTNEKNGSIYNVDENEEIGDEIGKFENGKPMFYKK